MKKTTQKNLTIIVVILVAIIIIIIILVYTQQIKLTSNLPFFESNWHKLQLNPEVAAKYS